MLYHFSQANFEQEVLQSDMPVMVDFYADWCGPCKMVAPIVEALSKEYDGKVKIGKLNVDESVAIAQKYNVMSIPTLLFIKNGQVVDQIVGAIPKPGIAQKLNALL